LIKRTNFDVIKQEVNELGYELVSEKYIEAHKKLIIKDKYNYLYSISYTNLHSGRIPHIVHKNNPYSIHNIKLFLKSNNYDFTLLSEKYEGEDIPLILLDSEGYFYSQTWRTLLKLTRQLFVSGNNIYSTQNIQLFLEKNNVELKVINQYKSNKDKLILCDNDGYLYTSLWGNLQKLWIPDFINFSNEYSIQNIHLWCKLNDKPYKLLSKEYKNNSKLLLWKCLENDCQEEFKMCWNNILQGQKCGYCTGKQVGLSNCLAIKYPIVTSEWHLTKNGKLTPYDVTWGSGKYAWWKCAECDHEWEATISSRTSRNSGCPECNEFHGEKKCRNFYKSNNFTELSNKDYNKLFDTDKYNNTYFIPHKTFSNLRGVGNGLLSYDSYLPKYNLLVEYQGEQHERPVDFNGKGMKKAQEKFEKQVEHDKRKKEYAETNNYNFLEIWYWDFDNIEEIIAKKLLEILQQAS